MTGKREPRPARHTDLQRAFMAGWIGGTVATITDAEGARNLLRTMAT